MQSIRIKSVKITYSWSSRHFSRCGPCHSQKLEQLHFAVSPWWTMKDFCPPECRMRIANSLGSDPGRRHRRIISARRSPVQESKEFDVEPGHSNLLASPSLSYMPRLARSQPY